MGSGQWAVSCNGSFSLSNTNSELFKRLRPFPPSFDRSTPGCHIRAASDHSTDLLTFCLYAAISAL